LAAYSHLLFQARFALSGDGRLLARQVGDSQLEVRDALAGGPPLCVTRVRGFQKRVTTVLGDRWLLLRRRKVAHLIRWDGQKLQCKRHRGVAGAFLRAELAGTSLSLDGITAQGGALPGFLDHAPPRSQAVAHGPLLAAVDAVGQVALFESNGRLVCMFFVGDGDLAAWAPPDVGMGPARLLGGPPTPGADEKIGRALLAAWERGKTGGS
jgi:hypothetical protein